MITLLAKLLKALNAETSPWALAWAFVLGMFLGLTPLFSLHNILILFLALSLRINLTGFIVAFIIFSGIAYIIDPLFDYLGESILQAEALQGFWIGLYENPLARLLQYNHTITMGSVVFALLFAIPWLFISYYLIVAYRGRVKAWFERLRFVQVIKGTKFFVVYQRISGLRGGSL
ncbi:TIGR03546 family protein [Idiomarina sp. A28L]|uniref:TIGR03546 family protein n=1 Tax=Idiomarina sp. A28L TaxID=1036674 RepID=UPI000213864C|nr:TIGR03546 family protein [Idiomarina sp. A28L]EGN75220.1 TIGR03546 family protein [Idiomarina sp. A28L]